MMRKQMLTGVNLLFLLAIVPFVLLDNAFAGDLILAREYYLFGAHCNYVRD